MSYDELTTCGQMKFFFANPKSQISSKITKLGFQSEFSMTKIIQILLNFFSMKNKIVGLHFFLKLFFGNFNFKTNLSLKLCPIFDEVQLCRLAFFSPFVLRLLVHHRISNFGHQSLIHFTLKYTIVECIRILSILCSCKSI